MYQLKFLNFFSQINAAVILKISIFHNNIYIWHKHTQT